MEQMANGGKSSNSKERELSIANLVKLWKYLVTEMVRTYLFNTLQETLRTKSSPSSMLITPKLIESTQRES